MASQIAGAAESACVYIFQSAMHGRSDIVGIEIDQVGCIFHSMRVMTGSAGCFCPSDMPVMIFEALVIQDAGS